MTAIQWEEPPPRDALRSSCSVSPFTPFAEALRANPGKWAVYPAELTPSSAVATAQQIKRGLRALWQPAGTYDAVARTVDGTRKVYVRYVGSAS